MRLEGTYNLISIALLNLNRREIFKMNLSTNDTSQCEVKDITIIPPPYFPIPAVKGGAVETLIEMFIRENEVEQKYSITCFSKYDEEAIRESQNIKLTKFVYINNKKFGKVKYQISRLFNRLFSIRPYVLDDYHNNIYKYLKNGVHFDAILVEGGSCINELKKISSLVGPDKMYLHVHLNYTPSRRVAHIFSNLIAVSDFSKKIWNKDNIFSSCTVVPNAVYTDKYHQSNYEIIKSLRARLGYNDDDFIVLFCGRLTEVKGIRELIKAVLKINNEHIKLIVLGSSNFFGAKLTPFQKEIKCLAYDSKRIFFTGYVPHSEVPQYYDIAQVVCVPSIYEDPAPLVAIEAMASGKPLIISNSGGLPEYIPEEGRLLVDKGRPDYVDALASSIQQLYDNSDLRVSMEKINYEESKYYSNKNYYSLLGKCLENTLYKDGENQKI